MRQIIKTPNLLNRSSSELKILEDETAVEYLRRLNTRLGNLSAVLAREGNEFVEPYLEIVQNTMKGLMLKHEINGQDKIDFSLTISAIDSGFPTEKDIYLLEKNQEEAKATLQFLPERDEIIDLIRKAIFRNGSVANGQTMLRRHNFYSFLDSARLLRDYHLDEAKLVKDHEQRRYYTLEWACVETGSRLPVLYRMYLTQDSRFCRLEKRRNLGLETIIFQTQMGFIDLSTFARTVDNEIEEVHPKLVEKYTIGPYYDKETNNSHEMQAILEKAGNPSILKFTVEKVLSERVSKYGGESILERIFNCLFRIKTEREVYGPTDSETKMIVPFRLKQELRNRDEYGNACQVYGVTMEGNIVG